MSFAWQKAIAGAEVLLVCPSNPVVSIGPILAVPGVREALLRSSAPKLAISRTSRGIPFGGRGGELTDLFFLIPSTDDAGHLRTLARLGRVLGIPGTLDEIREAPDAGSVREILLDRERGL